MGGKERQVRQISRHFVEPSVKLNTNTHTHTHTHPYTNVCVCVSFYVQADEKRYTGRMAPSGQSFAGTFASRKSHSAQSAVCVVMVEPSAEAWMA